MRRQRIHTPTVSFADREDFRPKRPHRRENYNPYSPLAMQRSRAPLDRKDNSVDLGYGLRTERIDYAFSFDLELNASNRTQRGFKVDSATMSLWRSYISGKL